MDAIPSVGPFVGEAPEDRHAERVVGEMLTCLDDFAATVQPRLEAAMGAHIPGSVKGRERFLARLKAVPSPAIINVAGAVGKRCRFQVLLSLWKRDEFGGANVISCTAFADGPGTEKRDSFVRWRISRHALVRLVQRSQAHDAIRLLNVMRVMARAVIIVLTDSSLLKDQPGALKVPFAGGVAVLELPEPGALIVVKTILPPQGTA
jgi:hypothetical protein